MSTSEELKKMIALKSIPLVGDVLARRLIEVFGTAVNIFSLSVKDMLRAPGIGKIIAEHIVQFKDKAMDIAEKELCFIEKEGVHCTHLFEENYPSRLKQCVDAPLFLFVKGNVDLDCAHVLSVVGTRKATVYGRNMTESLIKNLNISDLQIVSGLAYGIDTAAHTAAVEAGIPTIGVLGHGLMALYPAENKKLADKMMENGALLTEFLSFQKVEKEHFPIRNRIIAGLADAVLVIEARSRGGALITAEIANSYNRDVFSLPGRASDKNSKGCNWLIRTNRAALIETAGQLKYHMSWEETPLSSNVQTKLNIVLDPKLQEVYNFLEKEGECNVDLLCRSLELTMNAAATILLDLEFQGLINSLPGKRYRLARS